jgi:hypothetical protein
MMPPLASLILLEGMPQRRLPSLVFSGLPAAGKSHLVYLRLKA